MIKNTLIDNLNVLSNLLCGITGKLEREWVWVGWGDESEVTYIALPGASHL